MQHDSRAHNSRHDAESLTDALFVKPSDPRIYARPSMCDDPDYRIHLSYKRRTSRVLLSLKCGDESTVRVDSMVSHWTIVGSSYNLERGDLSVVYGLTSNTYRSAQ